MTLKTNEEWEEIMSQMREVNSHGDDKAAKRAERFRIITNPQEERAWERKHGFYVETNTVHKP